MGLGFPGMTAARSGGKPKEIVDDDDPLASYDPWFTSAVKQNLTQPVFSLALDIHGGGVLALGGAADVPIKGEYASTPILMLNLNQEERADEEFSYYTIIADDYLIAGQSLANHTTTAGPSNDTSGQGNGSSFPVIVDSGYSTNILPPSLIKVLYGSFKMPPEQVEFQSATLFTVPCDAEVPSFGIQIGGRVFEQSAQEMLIPNANATVNGTSFCALGSQPGIEEAGALGVTFLSSGFELVKQLLAKPEPYRFILGARDTERTKKAYDDLKFDSTTHSLTVLPLELSNLKTVKSFAQQTLEKLGRDRLDYFLLNAGMAKGASGPGPNGSKWCEAYVVNHLSVLDKNLLADSGTEDQSTYSESKFVQLLGAHWWRRQLPECRIVAVSPGLIPQTGIARHGTLKLTMDMPDAKTVPEGAQSILRAFTRDDFPADPEQIFLTSWGEWWGKDVYENSLDKALQDKWCPSQESIERDEGINA
ncbi:hypothetical protein SLS64_013704 [Diaporthe eres]